MAAGRINQVVVLTGFSYKKVFGRFAEGDCNNQITYTVHKAGFHVA